MLDAVIELADRFGVIDRIKDALAKQPDKANAKLAEVLDELAKTVSALEDEMVRYLSRDLRSEESIVRGRAVFLGMASGQSIVRINETRGHCHKIKNIYDNYLNTWFDQVFDSDSPERNDLRTSFEGLGSADDYIINAMKEVSAWLETQAEQTLDAVDAGNLVEANNRIRQARLAAKPARQKLIETMAKLRGVQADLIAQLGTV